MSSLSSRVMNMKFMQDGSHHKKDEETVTKFRDSSEWSSSNISSLRSKSKDQIVSVGFGGINFFNKEADEDDASMAALAETAVRKPEKFKRTWGTAKEDSNSESDEERKPEKEELAEQEVIVVSSADEEERSDGGEASNQTRETRTSHRTANKDGRKHIGPRSKTAKASEYQQTKGKKPGKVSKPPHAKGNNKTPKNTNHNVTDNSEPLENPQEHGNDFSAKTKTSQGPVKYKGKKAQVQKKNKGKAPKKQSQQFQAQQPQVQQPQVQQPQAQHPQAQQPASTGFSNASTAQRFLESILQKSTTNQSAEGNPIAKLDKPGHPAHPNGIHGKPKAKPKPKPKSNGKPQAKVKKNSIPKRSSK